MEHLIVEANGASFHVARVGEGPTLLLLHGWPEFWLAWEPPTAFSPWRAREVCGSGCNGLA
jgi:pimeloyl-ACP methyl ester carboxylesterase